MKFSKMNKGQLCVSIVLLFIFDFSFCLMLMANAESDHRPPQLVIFDGNCTVPNSTIIIHGMAYDESGIHSVTVNGEPAIGVFTSIHCFWQKTVNLAVGSNEITVVAYDNSSNHNYVTEKTIIIYQKVGYEGPTVKLIPITSQPANNVTISCIINPMGLPTHVYLWASLSSWANAPFNWGFEVGYFFGTGEILVSFPFPRSLELKVGESVSYIFVASNSKGTAFTEVATFIVTEPVTVDNEPPILNVWPSSCNVPSSTIIVHGEAYDKNGIYSVTVNGEPATGYIHENWFFWQKPVNLTEGPNVMTVLACDNSSSRLTTVVNITITYCKTGYLGPTIKLLPATNLTSNTATLNCIINPNGLPSDVYIWYSESSWENAPFRYGRSLGWAYSGTEEILVSYHIKGEFGPGQSISYMFSVSNSEGTSFTEVATITFPQIDTSLANFSYSPEKPWVNETIAFNASESCSERGTITSYEWDFNDGNKTITTEPIISHTYTKPGKYTVKLEVKYNNNTLSTTATKIITVYYRTDLNKDTAVNILDLTIAAVAYQTKQGDPKWNTIADINNDETINIIDLSLIAKDYSKRL